MNSLAVCGSAILLGVLGAITALALKGTISGQDAVILLTSITSLGGGAIAHYSGVTSGAAAAAPPEPVAPQDPPAA